MPTSFFLLFFFFSHDTATTEIYTLSLHDALPILIGDKIVAYRRLGLQDGPRSFGKRRRAHVTCALSHRLQRRSEEHTSELQSPMYLVCRLLLEKKKKKDKKKSHKQTNNLPKSILS